MNKSDAIDFMAQTGAVCLWQLAYAYAYLVWSATGTLPDPATVPAAVQRRWNKRMSLRTAYQGVRNLDEHLKRALITISLTPRN